MDARFGDFVQSLQLLKKNLKKLQMIMVLNSMKFVQMQEMLQFLQK